MKTRVVSIACMLMLWSAGRVVLAETITVASGEWPPYSSEHIEKNGIATEIVRAVFREMGMDLELKFYPWNRCMESVKTARVRAAFPFTPTKERNKDFLFSDGLIYSTAKLFYCKKNHPKTAFVFNTPEDLKSWRVGGVKGYYYESVLESAGVEGDFAPEPANAFEKLMLGRTDLVISNELVGWHVINTHFPANTGEFGTLRKPFDQKAVHLIVSKTLPGSAQWVQRFNHALDRVKNRYVYRSLVKKINSIKNELK